MRRNRTKAVAVLAVQGERYFTQDGNSKGAYPRGSRDRFARKNSGQGRRGRLGAPAGDLHIITNVGEHKHFTRKGDNIYVTVPITVPEAALGSKIEVPTVEGKAQLRIPPGTQSGQRFRVRERGVPSPRDGRRGDLVVEVRLVLPRLLDERSKELLREFGRINTDDVRQTLMEHKDRE